MMLVKIMMSEEVNDVRRISLKKMSKGSVVKKVMA